ncbi:unnamed protein product [Linum tenue]|uniref:Activator of Hsp90 ATPase AHSA1-like N-terminal domain-containing protein n=1 Tax=Linum tenue TaxID=586396 RepID=A0AAV0R7Y9_9ROSI|nr:unnamed protein product [Linum tenue]
MENGDETRKEETQQGSSYRYWVREATADATPVPVPKKLSAQDVVSSQPKSTALGSVWNRAGTWEEKNLNKWSSDRIKELLTSVGTLDFTGGKAEIKAVSKCSGDAFLVTVRNKKRVGYTYELTLDIKGEWTIEEETKTIRGSVDIPEFSYGELDDLQFEVRLSDTKDMSQQNKQRISKDLKSFLEPVREKLLQFEQELKDR